MTTALRRGMTWAEIRNAARQLAEERGEWGGYPMMVDGLRLVMEPRFPLKNMTGAMFNQPDSTPEVPVDYTVLNSWYCSKRDVTVYVCREANGKSTVWSIRDDWSNRYKFWWNTLTVAAQNVWDVNTELHAIDKLKSLVTDQAFRCYMTAGSFIESSKRSRCAYIFRKQRPTIVLQRSMEDMMRPTAALCMHPLGYYEKSWAGVMTPTDDVIAHLLLMRADEARFWKKSNIHHFYSASAGL